MTAHIRMRFCVFCTLFFSGRALFSFLAPKEFEIDNDFERFFIYLFIYLFICYLFVIYMFTKVKKTNLHRQQKNIAK